MTDRRWPITFLIYSSFDGGEAGKIKRRSGIFPAMPVDLSHAAFVQRPERGATKYKRRSGLIPKRRRTAEAKVLSENGLSILAAL